jgi:hypothetical protein
MQCACALFSSVIRRAQDTFPPYLIKKFVEIIKNMLDYLHNVCLKHFSYYGELNDL